MKEESLQRRAAKVFFIWSSSTSRGEIHPTKTSLLPNDSKPNTYNFTPMREQGHSKRLPKSPHLIPRSALSQHSVFHKNPPLSNLFEARIPPVQDPSSLLPFGTSLFSSVLLLVARLLVGTSFKYQNK